MAGLAILCNGSAALAAVVARMNLKRAGVPADGVDACRVILLSLPIRTPEDWCEHFLVGRHLPAIDWSVFGTAASWVEAACAVTERNTKMTLPR